MPSWRHRGLFEMTNSALFGQYMAYVDRNLQFWVYLCNKPGNSAKQKTYLCNELDDFDEDVEGHVPGDHATRPLGEESRHYGVETTAGGEERTSARYQCRCCTRSELTTMGHAFLFLQAVPFLQKWFI